ncbi:MAG: SDR family oxidoreductase [Pseudomonadota bacterium]
MRQVLVTGGGTGIGKAIAHAFADAGDAVTIAGRRQEPLEKAAEGRAIAWRTADVTVETEVEALFAHAFDVVVANAGGGVSGKLAKTTLDDWNATLAVNLTGTFLTFRAALPGMTAGGRLIAIASTAALEGNASVPAYTAAKHGVLGLVRSVALEVAKSGVTCNAICPGFTDTALAETAITGVMARFEADRAAATKIVADANPQARLIDTDEVAAAALFLASAGARSVNGHALSLSGGAI